MLVGGGGAGGGDDHGAGGGAGGYRTGSTPISGPFSRTVIVGGGGNGIASQKLQVSAVDIRNLVLYMSVAPVAVTDGGGAGAGPVSPCGGGPGGSGLVVLHNGGTVVVDLHPGSGGNDGGTGANGGN